MRNIAIFAMCLVASCANENSYTVKQAKIEAQKGRFAVIAASSKYPPLIVDTISGCVIAVTSDLPAGKTTGLFDDLLPASDLHLAEVKFEGGSNPCDVMRQVPVLDTFPKG